MRRYEHGGGVGENIRLDFSVNTNPLGIDEKIKNAVIKNADSFALYPDSECSELTAKLAEYEGVGESEIICGNGASELIFAVVRAVMPKTALLAAPTFSEYERALLSVGCNIEYYSTSEENSFLIDRDFVTLAEEKDMVFVCNPNNPTGSICDRSVLEELARKNTVCVVDECFMDFADGYSMKGKLPVIKAFTKTYAMAGLRLGYIIADGDFVKRVRDQLPEWNVSNAAQCAGLAALLCDDYRKRSIETIKREREYLRRELQRLGFKVFPSDVNFLLVKNREGIGEELLRRGIRIRLCDNFRGLDGRFYRIAVKKRTENEQLIRELGDILG